MEEPSQSLKRPQLLEAKKDRLKVPGNPVQINRKCSLHKTHHFRRKSHVKSDITKKNDLIVEASNNQSKIPMLQAEVPAVLRHPETEIRAKPRVINPPEPG